MNNNLMTYSLLNDYPLDHFTTTRGGGVSKGSYSTMNLSAYSNDNANDVLENRHRFASSLGIPTADLYIPYQTHDDKIALLDHNFIISTDSEKEEKLHGVDALITSEKNICIGITTADCVPLIIYDPINHVLGVAHAGWKGTVARIAVKTVLAMKQAFSSKTEDLLIVIGPSISQEIFEVGDEVGEAFINAGFKLDSISTRSQETGKLHIDLWQANKEQLLEVDVLNKNIEVSGICSYLSENCFSARRQTINSGRMLTGGVLR